MPRGDDHGRVLGDHEKGWPAVGARYHWAAARFRDSGAALEVEYLTAFESGDLAVTTAIQRAVVRINVPPFARRHAAAGRQRSGAAQRSTAAVGRAREMHMRHLLRGPAGFFHTISALLPQVCDTVPPRRASLPAVCVARL